MAYDLLPSRKQPQSMLLKPEHIAVMHTPHEFERETRSLDGEESLTMIYLHNCRCVGCAIIRHEGEWAEPWFEVLTARSTELWGEG